MRKKILFLNGHLNAGGVEKSLADLLCHIDYEKYEVDLLLFEGLGDYADVIPEQVNVRLADLSGAYGSLPAVLLRGLKKGDWFSIRFRAVLLLCRLMGVQQLRHVRKMLFQGKKYDVVVGFRPGICTNIAAFAAEGMYKLSWWHHGEYDLTGAENENYRLACGEMDAVASVSQSCSAFLKENHPELSDKVVVIHNIVSVEEIREKANTYVPYKRETGMTNLVSVGRLSPEKHMENVLFAARYLLDRGFTSFKWHIVGDGSERTSLENMAREYGVAEHVSFAGNRPNPYPYVKSADLFVHPSYVESQGLAILEAMALGVPCVVTRSLGPCEFIEDGVNGLLTEQTPESLAEKVIQILSDRELYQNIKTSTRCPDRFLAEQVMEKIEALLDQ